MGQEGEQDDNRMIKQQQHTKVMHQHIANICKARCFNATMNCGKHAKD